MAAVLLLAYLAGVCIVGWRFWPMPYRRTATDWAVWATLGLFSFVTLFTLLVVWVLSMVLAALSDPDPVPR